ncbi:hypothetical protein EVAR_68762_1, partial [Eumeta japonica]
EEEPEDEDEIR